MSGFFRKALAAFLGAAVIFTLSSCGDSAPSGNIGDIKAGDNDVFAVIKIMDYGEITVKLFPDIAPESVKRFTEFAQRGYYDGRTIHRVIDNYLIQGGSFNGDGSDGNVPDSQFVQLETSPSACNFYGALCFAPSKKGSYAQFYIVDRNKNKPSIEDVIDKLSTQLGDESITSRMTEEDLKKYKDYLDKLKSIPAEVKEKYARVGGLYELDGETTVFGQITDGYEVLEAITASEVVAGNLMDDREGTPSKPIDPIVIESVDIIKIEPEVSETTTEKTKATKKTTTSQIINAETLPPLPQTSEDTDTTVPASEGETSKASEEAVIIEE